MAIVPGMQTTGYTTSSGKIVRTLGEVLPAEFDSWAMAYLDQKNSEDGRLSYRWMMTPTEASNILMQNKRQIYDLLKREFDGG